VTGVTVNRRVMEIATGQKGAWVDIDLLTQKYFKVKWDDGTETEEFAGDLLGLNQAELDRVYSHGGRLKGFDSDSEWNLKDVDAEAARLEEAIGNPVTAS
jgi:hypothetical protein